MTDPKKLREDLLRITSGLRQPLSGALLTAAMGPEQSDLVACRWEFFDSADKPAVRPSVDYGAFSLKETWIEGHDKAVDLLLSIVTAEAGFFGKAPHAQYQYGGGSAERKISPWPSLSGWSEWVLETQSVGNFRSDWLYAPAVRVGLPPFLTGAAAINDWLWDKSDPHASSVDHAGQIVIIIPDTRGRFVETTWSPGRLEFKIECRCDGNDVEAQCIVTTSSGPLHLENQRLCNGDSVGWDVPANTVRAEAFLIHACGDLLAKGSFTNTGRSIQVTSGPPSVEEQAKIDLQLGEKETIEYKPFMKNQDPKWHEVTRTVVAFANTEGGAVYLGVNDEGTPLGGSALAKLLYKRGCNPGEIPRQAFRRLIDECVREKVKPVPDYRTYEVTISGEPVFVLKIEKDDKGPYATHENDVYIRKGATNRRPDPKTEMPRAKGKRLEPPLSA